MNKVGRVFEIGYLFVAVVFGYTAFEKRAEEGWWVYLILMVLAIFMFFFRRKFRLKNEERLKQNK